MSLHLRTLSNKEVVQVLHSRRDYSPVVDELCRRLEMFDGTCPVCEADLSEAFELTN